MISDAIKSVLGLQQEIQQRSDEVALRPAVRRFAGAR